MANRNPPSAPNVRMLSCAVSTRRRYLASLASNACGTVAVIGFATTMHASCPFHVTRPSTDR